MSNQVIKKFSVIGISIRTTNENDQSSKDIPAFWDRFMSEAIAEKIPNKIGDSVYCVYTDYEKDYTKPYSVILGCKVSSLDNIPDGMVGHTLNETNYAKFVAKGNISQGSVYKEWSKIWNSDLQRAYTADFEVYDERAQNPKDAVVDIFVAIK